MAAASDSKRAPDGPESVHLETVEAWHEWLDEHHRRPKGVWLVSWKRRTGRPAIAYEAAVEEALCFGWIDGTARSLDEERGMQWFSPRRKGSLWARSNRERVARLEAEGRMTEAGRAAVTRARADGTWTLLEPIEDLIVPSDLGAALDARPGARARWASFPPTAQRAYLLWIATAKRDQTRRVRIERAARQIARGERL